MKTAVLFLAFNRPDTTRQVFEAIRKAKPPRLYVAVDGPRESRYGECIRVAKVREIATEVDWQCEVKTLFREHNLGCKIAVSNAIKWFFEQEEQGIILEDDCLPSQSFFLFCEHMLGRYKEDKKIWMVNGFNPRYPGAVSSKYFLSKNPSVWGWATWGDRWSKYDIELSFWDKETKLSFSSSVPRYVNRYYQKAFEATKNGLIDTWDYQLVCLILTNNGYVVKPYANLVSNIGVIGTHAGKRDKNHFVSNGAFMIEDDADCSFDIEQDLWFYRTRIKKPLLHYPSRVLKIIKGFLS